VVTTRVARWSAPVGEHCVSERPRLTVSVLERDRRRSTVDVRNGFGGHALPVLASGYLSRPVLWVVGPLRSRPRLCGGRRRPRAGPGRGEHGRTASVGGTARVRRRRAQSPVRGSKSRSSSSRPPTIGLARVLLLRRRDGRPPGRRFSVSVRHSYW
jgi:hypothetical protein